MDTATRITPAEQARLPLELEPEPSRDRPDPAPAVPPDALDADRPIGFALTARARRAVAPASLPALEVVSPSAGATGLLEQPDDTRPARARALRRAGVPVAAVARQLGCEPWAVAAWTGEAVPAAAPSGRDTSDRGQPAPSADDHEVAFQLARAAAAEAAVERLGQEPAFALTAGLLAAAAGADAHAVTVTSTDLGLAARVLTSLAGEQPDVTTHLRGIVRVGSRVAGDLARHRVAAELGIEVEQLRWTRWHAAPSPDAVQVMLRVTDPVLAASVAGWRDAVLQPHPAPEAAWGS